MALIIDFRTRLPLPRATDFAVLDIIEGDVPHDDRLLFDGLAPRSLVQKLQKICDEHNEALK